MPKVDSSEAVNSQWKGTADITKCSDTEWYSRSCGGVIISPRNNNLRIPRIFTDNAGELMSENAIITDEEENDREMKVEYTLRMIKPAACWTPGAFLCNSLFHYMEPGAMHGSRERGTLV